MNILVIGGGGREHAIVKKISESKRVSKIYCAPGNGGISDIAECVPIKVMEFEKLIEFAKEKNIDLTVVGPDDPLVYGISDAFKAAGLKVFGPTKDGAQIEGSKVFSKELMKKYNIPTAKYEVFESYDEALTYIESENSYPAVIKAEGLALGKGVIIAKDLEEAKSALKEIMIDKVFGDSGNRVVIEEFLTGPEISVLSFCDGETIVPMVSAQDHKRAYDNDEGPNTGGMGTFSPSRIYNKELQEECMNNIFLPTVNALRSEGIIYKGVIFFGLMSTKNGVKVIEYNARFGDPETQVVLPRLKTDIVDIFEAVCDGTLKNINVEWEDNACVCVVEASGGYPKKYQTGYEIEGLDNISDNIFVYHAGTKKEDGKYLTAGGRVLGITAKSRDLDTAISDAYKAVKNIYFTDVHFRKDIGVK
ncbi:MAG: phosphoribosylamine--glycine ligase [Ruminococcaceae bacterium]|nr:phosphoribosylamine--glycine ligase [Oscillospiraceae bacterium]